MAYVTERGVTQKWLGPYFVGYAHPVNASVRRDVIDSKTLLKLGMDLDLVRRNQG